MLREGRVIKSGVLMTCSFPSAVMVLEVALRTHLLMRSKRSSPWSAGIMM
jgi:hypothetical protein